MRQGGIPWATVASGLVLAAVAAYLLMISAEIAEQARLYPRIFLLATLAGSIALAIGAVVRGRRPEPAGPREAAVPGSADTSGGASESRITDDPDRAGWPLYPALVLYVLALDRLGFVVSTILFLAGVLLWLRVPAVKAVPLAVAGSLAIFAVFRTAMYVSLPAGPVDIYLLELIYSG